MIVPPRVVLARILDRCARRCARLAETIERAATTLYRRHTRRVSPHPQLATSVHRAADLVLVRDARPIEHIGGPNDGEFLRGDDNGVRTDGLYVVQNNDRGQCVAKRFVPWADMPWNQR